MSERGHTNGMVGPRMSIRMPRRTRRRPRLGVAVVIAALLVVAGLAADRAWIRATPDQPVRILPGDGSGGAGEVAVFRGGGRASGPEERWRPGEVATGPVSGVVFGRCGQPSYDNCVIDGDSFHLGGRPIRIADIDAPEVSEPGCLREAELGRQAAERLLVLLNAGPFTLEQPRGTGHDRYGRELRLVMREGRSLGAQLVAEGLARAWDAPSGDWCGFTGDA